MKNFYIITNAVKDEQLEFTKKICDYIQIRGGDCAYQVSVDPKLGNCSVLAKKIPAQVEVILVIGGDGTLIRAARDLVDCDVPLIGVNQGHLGYLCELEEETIYSAIDLMILEDRKSVV